MMKTTKYVKVKKIWSVKNGYEENFISEDFTDDLAEAKAWVKEEDDDEHVDRLVCKLIWENCNPFTFPGYEEKVDAAVHEKVDAGEYESKEDFWNAMEDDVENCNAKAYKNFLSDLGLLYVEDEERHDIHLCELIKEGDE